jgi:hypothetical protein
MKSKFYLLPALLALFALGACATENGRYRISFALPADTPDSYRSECGNCHIAFPPGLLPDNWWGDGWQHVMEELDAHFGETATVPEPVRREIAEFLARHAGSTHRVKPTPHDPPRLTTSQWFRLTHGEVKRYFRDPRVGSPVNCPACHLQAESGDFHRLTALGARLAGRD